MSLFSLTGKTAVVTGGSGAIGGAIARGFAQAGADLALTYNNNAETAEQVVADTSTLGVRARCYRVPSDAAENFDRHADQVMEDFGRLDILVNCAGGNLKTAITDRDKGFFDLPAEAIRDTVLLNFMGGAVFPCMAYGRKMADAGSGSIINISSMNGYRPLEGRPAYAAAKAAVNNFTQWLACHLAMQYTPALRVNAIAPGFFPNERMRDALFETDGSPNARGRRIIEHTPMGRLGVVEDLVGTAIWYAADASTFVTGTVTPVDGGFNAYAGL